MRLYNGMGVGGETRPTAGCDIDDTDETRDVGSRMRSNVFSISISGFYL